MDCVCVWFLCRVCNSHVIFFFFFPSDLDLWLWKWEVLGPLRNVSTKFHQFWLKNILSYFANTNKQTNRGKNITSLDLLVGEVMKVLQWPSQSPKSVSWSNILKKRGPKFLHNDAKDWIGLCRDVWLTFRNSIWIMLMINYALTNSIPFNNDGKKLQCRRQDKDPNTGLGRKSVNSEIHCIIAGCTLGTRKPGKLNWS